MSIHLVDPDGIPVPAALPGQFLTLRLQPEPGQPSLLRNYSLSGPPGADDYRISVKREPDGAGSGYLHTHLRVGDRLEIAAPRGTFTLNPNKTPVLLISAGVGATPTLAMLHALAAEHSEREVWWLHGARNGADHPFADESRTLLASLANGRGHIAFSRPGPDDIEGRDFDSTGRLSPAVLASLELPHDADAYLCGPASFMSETGAALAELGLDPGRIHLELFGPAPGQTPGIASAPSRPPHLPTGTPGSGPTIEFSRSNLAVAWSTEYPSLLELAEACDVPVRWSCRTGVCHSCETAIVSGTVEYNPDPVEPPADGSVAHLLRPAERPSDPRPLRGLGFLLADDRLDEAIEEVGERRRSLDHREVTPRQLDRLSFASTRGG